MNTLNVTFCYTVKSSEETQTINYEFSDGNCTKDGLMEAITEELNGLKDEEAEDITPSDIELISLECDEDIHPKYNNIDDIFDYAQTYCECEQDADVVNAAINCDIQGSDIDEAYSGCYKDDEDFAQETAEQLGCIDKNAVWPMNCIDWEQAARELMYDYSEDNGYYFRNL